MYSKISASAMKHGLIIGCFFALVFLLAVSGNNFLVVLSNLIVIFSIILVYRYTVKYRETENDGAISYGQAFLYVLLLYLFGSIISGAVVFVYCKFINPDYLSLMLEDPHMQQSVSMVTSIMGVSEKQVEESLELLLSPSMYAFQYVWSNTFFGVIVGLILPFFIRKAPKNTDI